MARIEVYVLQTPKIYLDGAPVIFPYKKAEALLYYMAVEKHATRDRIAALLWDTCEESTAKKNLRHALYTIRKLLHEDCIISPDRQNLALNPQLDLTTDYARFQEKKETGFYQTEFLNGFYVKNAEPYEEWMNWKRKEVRDTYLRILEEKLRDSGNLSVSQAEQLFEQYIREDSLDEQAYYHMMKIYGEHRMYYKGIRLYQQLASLLDTELKVVPKKEIRQMHQRFLQEWSMETEQPQDTLGHAGERQKLEEAHRQFLTGKSKNILLTGESGVGKTYLAKQLVGRASAEGTMVFQAVCMETEQQMNLQPWNVVMLQVANAAKDRKLQMDEQYLQAADWLFPFFKKGGDQTAALTDNTISYSYRSTRNLLLRFFSQAGKQKPILLVFDNIQYMDLMSLEFLSVLIRAENKNLMILLTCPDSWNDRLKRYLSPLVKGKYIERVFVTPFSKDEVKKITEKSLGKEAAKPEFIDRIYEESRGNAYFLEMLLREYARGNLKEGEPSRFEELLRDQLEALPKGTRQVLELISACQAWADMDSLEHILKRDSLDLLNAVEELKEKGFLYEKQMKGEVRLLFCHGSMQKFVHGQMAPSKCKVFHSMLAEYIEGLPSYEYGRWERLIYHYTICGNKKKALEYRIFSASEYVRKFYELYPVFSSSCDKGAFQDTFLLEQCREMEEELLELEQKEGAGEELDKLYIRLMLTKAQYCIPKGYYEEGTACAEKALKTNASSEEDPLIKIQCLRLLIHYQLNVWELDKTGEYLEESLNAAKKGRYKEEYAVTCRLYGLYYSMTGEFERGMEYLKKSLAYFEGVPLKSRIYAANISACYIYMGEIMRKQKDFRKALEFYRCAVEICEYNHCPCNAVVYCNMGMSWLELGEKEKSRAAFYKAEEIYDESFTLIGRSINKGYVSILEAEAGNRKKARKLLWEAQESARQFASPYTLGILCINQAQLKEEYPQIFSDILRGSPEEYRKKACEYLKRIPGAYEAEKINTSERRHEKDI